LELVYNCIKSAVARNKNLRAGAQAAASPTLRNHWISRELLTQIYFAELLIVARALLAFALRR